MEWRNATDHDMRNYWTVVGASHVMDGLAGRVRVLLDPIGPKNLHRAGSMSLFGDQHIWIVGAKDVKVVAYDQTFLRTRSWNEVVLVEACGPMTIEAKIVNLESNLRLVQLQLKKLRGRLATNTLSGSKVEIEELIEDEYLITEELAKTELQSNG